MAAFFTSGLQSQTTLETFFRLGGYGILPGGALVSARLCRLPEQEVHQPSSITNSFVGAVETTAPPCEYQPSSTPTKQSFIRRVWHPAIPTPPPMVRDSVGIARCYTLLWFDGRCAQILADATAICQPLSL